MRRFDVERPCACDGSGAPSSPCSADLARPQIVATQPSDLPAAVWSRQPKFQARLRFRVDENGAPESIRVTVRDAGNDREALESAVATAVAAYRFCRPVNYAVSTEWSALMLFSFVQLDRHVAGGGETYIQQFVPAYTHADVRERRTGAVKVRGTFGPDGRPTAFTVSSSSGDGVLDQKNLEAMATLQLVFRPGSVLPRPVVFEQPYRYDIQ